MSQERIGKAIRYVSQYQLPVNEALAGELQRKLQKDQISFSTFLKEVTNEPGLFVRCLRNALSDGTAAQDPIRALRARELGELANLLSPTVGTQIVHDLHAANDDQKSQYVRSTLAVTTSEVLAENLAGIGVLSPEAVKAAALLRQLGLSLIAWNYPGVYNTALCNVSQGDDLESVLTRRLGFSPHMLAFRLLTSWGVSHSYLRAIGLSEEQFEDDLVERSVSQTLSKICQVGEMLARACCPEGYPEAERNWESAKVELKQRLGASGFSQVMERYEENIEDFIQLVPEVFHPGLVLDGMNVKTRRELETVDSAVSPELAMNPYFELCSLPLQRALRGYYLELAQSASGENSIHKLIFEIAPLSVLRGGIVYTVDPFRQIFSPQAAFGQVLRSSAREISTLLTFSDGDIVTRAFQTIEVVTEEVESAGPEEGENEIASLASVLGRSQRVGVLYAECDRESLRGLRAEHDLRALAFALCSALKLK
jgi:hypothetical protein